MLVRLLAAQELQQKHRIMQLGWRVVDLGAAPGGWSVVAQQAVGSRGQLVCVDLLRMQPLRGNATILQVQHLRFAALKRHPTFSIAVTKA